MSDEEKIDLNKLTPKELMIRILDRQVVVEDELKIFIKKVDIKFEKIDELTVKNRISIAVLQSKALGISVSAGLLGGGIITGIISFLIK